MRRFLFAVILLTATGALGPRTRAEVETESKPHDLADTIVVTANRVGTSLRENSNSITIINREQIDASQAVMVSDLLRTAPGLDIVRSGGAGQQTSAFLRGSNSEHVLVLMDGVEMNDPSSPNGSTNLAHLLLDNIERIEILRGPQSVLYGSDAIAGVIQIFTRRGNGEPQVRLSAEAGAFGTFLEQLTLTGGNGRIDYSASLARQDSDGISVAAVDGTAEPDSYENTTGSLRLDWRAAQSWRMNLSGRWTDAETGLDQSSAIPDDPNFRLESTERLVSANLVYGRTESRWDQRIGVTISDFDRTSINGVDNDHPLDTSLTEYGGQRIRFDWQHNVKLIDQLDLTAGIETERESMEQALFFASLAPEYYPDYYDSIADASMRTNSAYLQGRLSLNDRWYTTASVRRDDHESFGGHTTFRLTSAYLFASGGPKLSATFGSGFKAPTLVQLHDGATGNPQLKPETSEGWEFSMEQRLAADRIKIGGTLFHTDFSDLIQYVGSMVNKGSVSIRGTELFGQISMERYQIRLDYTNTNTRDNADGQPLIRRARDKFSLTGTGQITNRLSAHIRASYVGSREDVDYSAWPYERVELDPYTLVNLAASYTVSESVTLKARVDNLLDAEYEEVLGFGSAPVALYGGVVIDF